MKILLHTLKTALHVRAKMLMVIRMPLIRSKTTINSLLDLNHSYNNVYTAVLNHISGDLDHETFSVILVAIIFSYISREVGVD